VYRFDLTEGAETKSWLVDLKNGSGSVSECGRCYFVTGERTFYIASREYRRRRDKWLSVFWVVGYLLTVF
jgi:hypothetical protein